MKIPGRVFAIVTTLFIFLPITWVVMREVNYRAKHGNTPIPSEQAVDTTHVDSTTKH